MSVSLEEVAQDLKDMNNNAQALLEKYNNAGTKLDTKTKELLKSLSTAGQNGLNAIENLINNGAGKVLQIKTAQFQVNNNTYTSISSGVYYDTQVKLKITPKSANSKLIIFAEHQVRFINAYGMYAGLKRDGSFVNPANKDNSLFFTYKGDRINHHTQARVHTAVPSNNTNETEFILWVRPHNKSAEVNNGRGNRFIMIMEVAE
jgi:tRNA splicing endonuclease